MSVSSKRRERPLKLSGDSATFRSGSMLYSSSLIGGPDNERSLRLIKKARSKKARSRVGSGKVSKKVYREYEGTPHKT